MTDKISHGDYAKWRMEFEDWVVIIQPNRGFPEWYQGYDCGYYTDAWFQGAWIAWLLLTKDGRGDL